MEYLVSWQDNKGVYHNGSFFAKNLNDLRKQCGNLGKITNIQKLNPVKKLSNSKESI